MAELDTRYQSTNDQLQTNISEALLQLDNLKRKVDSVATGVADLEVGDHTVTAPNVEFPNAPPRVNAQPMNHTDVVTGGISADMPDAPQVTDPGTWAGPDKPLKFNGFSSFFGGTPDTPEDIIDRANAAVDAWVDAYFPALKECFKSEPEQWICDVISGVRPLGNSEEAIYVAWRSAKANEFAELRSQQRALDAEYTTRGFTLPPGAMVAASQANQERMFNAVAQVNREAALKDVDIQVQLLSLAVQTAERLKTGLSSLMAEYYRTVASLTDDSQRYSLDKARIMADAESKFMDGLLTYHRINQGYYESLATTSLDYDRTRASVFDTDVRSKETLARLQQASEELRFRASELNSQNEARTISTNLSAGQINADIYNSVVRGKAAEVGAKVDIEQLKTAVFTAVTDAKVKVADVKTQANAGTGLAGIARAFGDIASAAANASGTLVAQIEGF